MWTCFIYVELWICFRFHWKCRKIVILLEIPVSVWTDLDGIWRPSPSIVYDVTLSIGDNTGNLVNWCRTAMGVDVFWLMGCPEMKLIDKFGVGDNTRNNFEALYLGRLWTDFDGVCCSGVPYMNMYEPPQRLSSFHHFLGILVAIGSRKWS